MSMIVIRYSRHLDLTRLGVCICMQLWPAHPIVTYPSMGRGLQFFFSVTSQSGATCGPAFADELGLDILTC